MNDNSAVMWGYLLLFVSFLNVSKGSNTDVVVLRAVRDREASLPCGQGKVFLDGPESYVLWLKNDRQLLYRYPNDETDRSAIYQTCEGDNCRDETALLLKRVSEQDGGIYRCRVHYQAAPSVDYVIDVKLVDSPGQPRIYNEYMEELGLGYVGPLSLGATMILICEIDDDKSDTLLYWRRNGEVIERAHTPHSGVLRADVRVQNLTRADLNAHYECFAQNADVTPPEVASVVVKMYLPPISVEIRLNNNPDFEAGQPRVVDCVVVGCVPPPSITWHFGENLLRPTVHKELHDGNYTVSSLTVAPSIRDDGNKLVCRAHNTNLPAELFEDDVTVHVGYRPVCLVSQEETIGVVTKQAETVTCVVEASPEPMQFSWTFPDSRTLYTSVKRVPGHQHRYSSTLTWSPKVSDLGLLLCRATNEFGEQKRPCTYSVIEGGPPQTPECIMLRSYPSALKVQCKKGWSGGRPQSVHFELIDSLGATVQNLSNPLGHFMVNGIDDRNFTAVVYTSNVRGTSLPTTLHLQSALPASAPVTHDRTSSLAHWLEASAGAIVILVAVIATTLCVRAFRYKNQDLDISPDIVPRSDGSFHREPDFAREERLLGTTNITVNQLASCPNKYSSSPCRVLVGCSSHAGADPNLTSQQTYYV